MLILLLRAVAMPAGCRCGASPAERECSERQSAEPRCADCPFERNGKDCPPDCPTCHCSQQGVSLPPVATAALVALTLADPALEAAPYEASVPRAPPPPGLYRPPRSAARIS